MLFLHLLSIFTYFLKKPTMRYVGHTYLMVDLKKRWIGHGQEMERYYDRCLLQVYKRHSDEFLPVYTHLYFKYMNPFQSPSLTFFFQSFLFSLFILPRESSSAIRVSILSFVALYCTVLYCLFQDVYSLVGDFQFLMLVGKVDRFVIMNGVESNSSFCNYFFLNLE